MAQYLVINGLEFKEMTSYGGRFYDILPSAVVPKTDIIKKTERALSGKMHIDIKNVKKSITITFDILTDKDFNFLRNYFSFDNVDTIDADGMEVRYFDFSPERKEKTLICYLDDVDYKPFIVGDEMKWRDISINLVEI